MPLVHNSNIYEHPTAGPSLAPLSGVAKANHQDVERDVFIGFGNSSSVIETLLVSCRLTTNRIYNITWKAFTRWCKRKGASPLKPLLGKNSPFYNRAFLPALRLPLSGDR